MKKKEEDKIPRIQQEDAADKGDFPGYPQYPSGEDIYNKSERKENIDSGEVIKKKSKKNEGVEKRNEKDFNEDKSGSDLDIPGSELDDEEEKVGSEDEENNYYSLGGDDHDDLEEDKGD